MRELPRGTVTLLFTDIEGSTRLLHELGDEYARALAEHRRLLREAFAAHGGVEIGTEGDAFFVVFEDAREAVAAAADAQAALSSGSIRVRMGLHTGTPTVTEEGYVGLDVHLAARIAACGHGGQVLLSKTTRQQLDGEIRDLGEHRLKDFDQPVWIFQLGDVPFPPLKTISNTNLPRPASPFVGREREVADVAELLRSERRLLTLTGPGGSGKTRLAIEAAADVVGDFPHGVYWILLATVRDAQLVLPSIGQALGAREELSSVIGDKQLLLLLDNFEHVVEAAGDVARLVEACPHLKVLVTSRELLRVRGEVEYEVLPLAEPDAVELFCLRSGLGRSSAIAELCRRLDSMPLALELAAARTKIFSPQQILDRLPQRLDLFRGGRDADPRQQTLRATISWSYDLLDPDEQRLFARLAVFAGGCTLEAAEAVLDADLETLQSLVEKNLVRHTAERFWMLETIRDYAFERLRTSREDSDVRARHADYFLAYAVQRRRAHAREILDALEAEHDNIRAARAWFRESGDVASELQLVRALTNFADVRGHWREAQAAAEAALSRGDSAPAALRADGWQALVQAAYSAGDLERARTAADESLALHRELGDEAGARDALFMLGLVAAERADFTEAAELTAESLRISERLGDENLVAGAKGNLGLYALIRGETAEAKALTAEALDVFRRLGDDQGVVNTLENLGIAEFEEGRLERARELLQESLERAQAVGFTTGTFNSLVGLAAVAAARGETERAAELLATADALREQSGATKLETLEERLYERAIAQLEEQVGAEALAARLEEARALAREPAVAETA